MLETVEIGQSLNVPRVAKVDVVVRSYHPDLEKLQALAAGSGERVSVALEPAEVTSRLVRCHFAVTAGSLSVLGLRFNGLTLTSIPVSER